MPSWVKTLGKSAVGLAVVVLLFAVLWEYFPSWSSSGGGNSTSTQTASTETTRCPGNGETKTVGSEWVEINPGYRCAVVFNTTSGVALLGEPSNFVEDAPGRQVGNVMRDKGIRVIFAKAKTGQARVNYMLCPHGTTSPTRWGCSS